MGERSRTMWLLAEGAACLVFIGAFLLLPAWITAKPIAVAPPEALASLPADCPAFDVARGVYRCIWLGTTRTNVVGFLLYLCVLAISLGVASYIHFSKRGYLGSFLPNRSES